jgi:hypothetical protein
MSAGALLSRLYRVKRFPAFGRQLMQRRMSGEVPREVIISLSWTLGRAFDRIVIPGDVPAENLDLRMLAGLDVTIAHHAEDAHRVPAVVDAVLAVKPRLLAAINVDVPKTVIIGGEAC